MCPRPRGNLKMETCLFVPHPRWNPGFIHSDIKYLKNYCVIDINPGVYYNATCFLHKINNCDVYHFAHLYYVYLVYYNFEHR